MLSLSFHVAFVGFIQFICRVYFFCCRCYLSHCSFPSFDFFSFSLFLCLSSALIPRVCDCFVLCDSLYSLYDKSLSSLPIKLNKTVNCIGIWDMPNEAKIGSNSNTEPKKTYNCKIDTRDQWRKVVWVCLMSETHNAHVNSKTTKTSFSRLLWMSFFFSSFFWLVHWLLNSWSVWHIVSSYRESYSTCSSQTFKMDWC